VSGRALPAGGSGRRGRLAFLLAAVLAAAPAWAATDLVTSTADSGPGSLRNTISSASSGDTIAFSLSTPTAITLSSGPLLLAKSLTFSGPGYADLTISGGSTVQIMQVDGAVAVSISGLSFAHGTANTSLTDGGFLDIEGGSVSLTQCWVSSNTMPDGGGLGGAIYAASGTTLTVEACTFTDNTVTASGAGSAEGGAIYGDTGSVVAINRSTLSANACYCPGCGAGPDNPLDVDGGGVYDLGKLTINGCLFSGNHADDHDGALYWYGLSGATASLTNSTFSGNTDIEEGAVAALASGQMALLNCTITDNTSQNYEAGLSGYDGEGTGGGLTVQNCVIAGNIAENMEGDNPNDVDIFVDVDGLYGSAETLSSGGWNLVGKSGSQTYAGLETGDGENDTVGSDGSPADPNLASLANNGGYADTVGFSSATGVPANPGSSNGAPFVDGRGYLRPGTNTVSSEGAYQENGTQPTADAMSAIGVSGFTANWTAVGGVSGYYLDVATDAAFTDIVSGYDGLSVAGASTTSKAVTGLSSGTTYYYRVRAYLSPYISWYSNTISGSTLAPSPTDTRTRTPTATPSHSPSSTVTETGTPTPSTTDTATASPSLTASATSTPSGTLSDSPTSTPSSTPTATLSNSPTDTPSSTPTLTFSDSPSDTATSTPTATLSNSPTDTASFTPSRTFSDSPTATRSPTPTGTFSNSLTATRSPTPTGTFSNSPTATRTPSSTPSFSDSPTATRTPSSTASPSSTATATASFTGTKTWTPSSTPTASPTPTDSSTPSPSWTASPTATDTATPGPSPTLDPTAAFLSSGQGKIILGPVPSRRGEPICLYMDAAPSGSQWTVYSMDQTVVARLSFGSEASQCWTDTQNLAPGVYWVHLSVTYASGGTASKVLKIMVID
jgi:hypothetical protein